MSTILITDITWPFYIDGVFRALLRLECPICLSNKRNVVAWLPCRHVFCTTCSDASLSLSPSCPLCRTVTIKQNAIKVEKWFIIKCCGKFWNPSFCEEDKVFSSFTLQKHKINLSCKGGKKYFCKTILKLKRIDNGR